MKTTDKLIIHIKDNICTFPEAMELVSRTINEGKCSPNNGKHGFSYVTVFGNPYKYCVLAKGKGDTTTFLVYDANYKP